MLKKVGVIKTSAMVLPLMLVALSVCCAHLALIAGQVILHTKFASKVWHQQRLLKEIDVLVQDQFQEVIQGSSTCWQGCSKVIRGQTVSYHLQLLECQNCQQNPGCYIKMLVTSHQHQVLAIFRLPLFECSPPAEIIAWFNHQAGIA